MSTLHGAWIHGADTVRVRIGASRSPLLCRILHLPSVFPSLLLLLLLLVMQLQVLCALCWCSVLCDLCCEPTMIRLRGAPAAGALVPAGAVAAHAGTQNGYGGPPGRSELDRPGPSDASTESVPA